MSADVKVWRHCSICKAAIGFEQPYLICSVSTCNRKRNPLYFCSLGCWEAHLPMMRHRDAWAEQAMSPSEAEWARQQAEIIDADEAEMDDEPCSSRRAPAFSDTDVDETTGVHRISEEVRVDYQESKPNRRLVNQPEASPAEELPRDILVVVSKLKKYIKARSGMNTSDGVTAVLSDHIRRVCNEAIRNAAREGRKTVMDRDFEDLI